MLVFLGLVFVVVLPLLIALKKWYTNPITWENFILIQLLKYDMSKIFYKAKVDNGHGLDHASRVAEHAVRASRSAGLSQEQHLQVLLASLLHDIDDHKFPGLQNDNGQLNAEQLLTKYFPTQQKPVLEMIAAVSTSANGNLVDPAKPSYFYIPRWADRLEAVGLIGIKRTLEHTRYTKQPYYLSETIKPKSRNELYAIPIEDRFNEYCNGKKSVSMIDHFYDKLLHLCDTKTGNYYLDHQFRESRKVMDEFLLEFGSTGEIPFYYEHFEVD